MNESILRNDIEKGNRKEKMMEILWKYYKKNGLDYGEKSLTVSWFLYLINGSYFVLRWIKHWNIFERL